ncbi:MAG TPA: helix-turn-helix domain-containing protein [Labilithrix sp.]|nr:helix-turn-helix domain-containing protein [Labilithrix sp.]
MAARTDDELAALFRAQKEASERRLAEAVDALRDLIRSSGFELEEVACAYVRTGVARGYVRLSDAGLAYARRPDIPELADVPAEAHDRLAEIVAERSKRNPQFADMVAEAETRRKLARRLARLRVKKALSQTVVASRMGTAASVVSKLEAGGDVKLSTLQRYFAAIGEKFAVAV